MNFDTLDKEMRLFEQSLDRTMLQGEYLAARLDGHGFTRLTKKDWGLEKPFDVKFRDIMIKTLRHLMDCGFRIVYGYTQSDEISLLFHSDDDTFGHKERKLLSILASEASVTFSLNAGRPAVFDCRLIPLPNASRVVDYFRWRQEDSHRNSLNAHCYWLLRNKGLSASQAQHRIAGISNTEKHELLAAYGIVYDKLPSWQKFGVGMFFKDMEKDGFNPVTKEITVCKRRCLCLEENLPVGNEYTAFISNIIKTQEL